MRLLDDAVINDKGVAFTTRPPEDGSAVEGQVERLGEGGMRVGEEADL